MVPLPSDLSGPVAVALAKAHEQLPAPGSVSGGFVYELKRDGFRCVVARIQAGVKLWSRQNKDLPDKFLENAAAVSGQVPAETVLDGELVIWNENRLDFDLLQRRMVNRPARALAFSIEHPATFMVFDVLAADSVDLRGRPLRERRAVLERVAASWSPPLQISPATEDAEGTCLEEGLPARRYRGSGG